MSDDAVLTMAKIRKAMEEAMSHRWTPQPLLIPHNMYQTLFTEKVGVHKGYPIYHSSYHNEYYVLDNQDFLTQEEATIFIDDFL